MNSEINFHVLDQLLFSFIQLYETFFWSFVAISDLYVSIYFEEYIWRILFSFKLCLSVCLIVIYVWILPHICSNIVGILFLFLISSLKFLFLWNYIFLSFSPLHQVTTGNENAIYPLWKYHLWYKNQALKCRNSFFEYEDNFTEHFNYISNNCGFDRTAEPNEHLRTSWYSIFTENV